MRSNPRASINTLQIKRQYSREPGLGSEAYVWPVSLYLTFIHDVLFILWAAAEQTVIMFPARIIFSLITLFYLQVRMSTTS